MEEHAPAPQLIVPAGDGTISCPIGADPVRLGRDPSNEIVFDDLAVSAFHATITNNGPSVLLRDAGSSNGTFVNGEQVAVRVLKHGDVVSIGDNEIHFSMPPIESRGADQTFITDTSDDYTPLIDLKPFRDAFANLRMLPGAQWLLRTYPTKTSAAGWILLATATWIFCRLAYEIVNGFATFAREGGSAGQLAVLLLIPCAPSLAFVLIAATLLRLRRRVNRLCQTNKLGIPLDWLKELGGNAHRVPIVFDPYSTIPIRFAQIAILPLLLSIANSIGGGIFTTLAFVAGLAAIGRMGQRLRSIRSVSADDARARDSRLPILWLRGFVDDDLEMESEVVNFGFRLKGQGKRFEEHAVEFLWIFGPVIAVGRENENLPPHGACRETHYKTDWEDRITERMRESQLIVFVIGKTAGLSLEFSKLVTTGDLARTIFLVPPTGDAPERIQVFLHHVTAYFPDHAHVAPHYDHVRAFIVDEDGRPVAFSVPGKDQLAFDIAIYSAWLTLQKIKLRHLDLACPACDHLVSTTYAAFGRDVECTSCCKSFTAISSTYQLARTKFQIPPASPSPPPPLGNRSLGNEKAKVDHSLIITVGVMLILVVGGWIVEALMDKKKLVLPIGESKAVAANASNHAAQRKLGLQSWRKQSVLGLELEAPFDFATPKSMLNDENRSVLIASDRSACLVADSEFRLRAHVDLYLFRREIDIDLNDIIEQRFARLEKATGTFSKKGKSNFAPITVDGLEGRLGNFNAVLPDGPFHVEMIVIQQGRHVWAAEVTHGAGPYSARANRIIESLRPLRIDAG